MLQLDKNTRINLAQARILTLENAGAGAVVLVQVMTGLGARQLVRCESVEAALQQADGEPFDLMICDGDLAAGQAFAFVSRLRRSTLEPNRYCPVILICGHTPEALVEQARDCGANFVVAKPLRATVLLERIIWVCMDKRNFVELDGYIGVDRRFQFLGPPVGTDGRRRGDEAAIGAGDGANLSQDEIDGVFTKPTKVHL